MVTNSSLDLHLKLNVIRFVNSKGRRDYQMPSKWPFSQPHDRHFNITNNNNNNNLFKFLKQENAFMMKFIEYYT